MHQRMTPVFSAPATRQSLTSDKERITASSSQTTTVTSGRSKEKERIIKTSRAITATASSGLRSPSAKPTTSSVARARTMQAKLPVSKAGGARRVPVGSEEAAPMGSDRK